MSQAPPEANAEPTASPQTQSWGKVGLIVAILAALVLLLWLAVSVKLANNRAQILSLERAGMTFAAASLPLLDMHSKGQIADGTSLDRVCDSMVANNSPFSFAALLDGNGNVVACSDRKFAKGTKFPDYKPDSTITEDTKDGPQTMQPSSNGTVTFGTVILRLR